MNQTVATSLSYKGKMARADYHFVDLEEILSFLDHRYKSLRAHYSPNPDDKEKEDTFLEFQIKTVSLNKLVEDIEQSGMDYDLTIDTKTWDGYPDVEVTKYLAVGSQYTLKIVA